jgi:ankyrin repeat protein
MLRTTAAEPTAATALLLQAAASGHTRIVEAALSYPETDVNAHVHSSDSNGGYTALMYASARGYANIVRLLLAQPGIDIRERTRNFSLMEANALHLAAEHGHAEIVRQLLDAGAAVDAPRLDRKTALILAAANGHADVVRLLLEKGAYHHARDSYEEGHNRALDVAKAAGHTEVINILHNVDMGAPMIGRAADPKGTHAEDVAAKKATQTPTAERQ